MALLRYFGVDFFLCFVRFFAVVDSSRRAAIVPVFVVDSSHFSPRSASHFEEGRAVPAGMQAVIHGRIPQRRRDAELGQAAPWTTARQRHFHFFLE